LAIRAVAQSHDAQTVGNRAAPGSKFRYNPATPMDPQATTLLRRITTGDSDAARELLPLLYDELRAIAGRQFRGQRADHTLQPTALVNEAFVKLLGNPSGAWNDRKHFFAVAATAMRQILVNHARDRAAQKRGGGAEAVLLNEEAAGASPSGAAPVDVLALNEALEKLKTIDERKHRVVELRFFAGLTVEEIADVIGVSKTTIEGEWRVARAWLATNLGDGFKA
jgi:RNA polymerase sigma-70 factor (ECF subfamily)